MTANNHQAPVKKASRSEGLDNATIFAVCLLFAGAMGGLAYASVPLYELFCQVTGYGGTTQRAESNEKGVIDRKINVRFDANVSRDLGWQFKPVQREVTLKLGEEIIIEYEATNTSKDVTSVGTATFNVTPQVAGQYFNKIACFCFTEQKLEPGQTVKMPVQFFVDPDIINDEAAKGVTTITLSYTFFQVDNPSPETAALKTNSNGPVDADGEASTNEPVKNKSKL